MHQSWCAVNTLSSAATPLPWKVSWKNFSPLQEDKIFIAADGATSVLLKAGVVPEIIVTDLDGCMDDILRANQMGSIVVVHAHGDNQDLLREYVPQLRNVIGTTQTRPPHGPL